MNIISSSQVICIRIKCSIYAQKVLLIYRTNLAQIIIAISRFNIANNNINIGQSLIHEIVVNDAWGFLWILSILFLLRTRFNYGRFYEFVSITQYADSIEKLFASDYEEILLPFGCDSALKFGTNWEKLPI